MIDSYEKIKIPDEGGRNDLVFEVNYDDTPKVQGCKILRVTYPDGSKGYLRRDYIHSMLFAISEAEQQRELIPAKIQIIRKYQTMLGITAQKNIKKGEKINVMVDIPLPPIEREIMETAKKTVTNGLARI